MVVELWHASLNRLGDPRRENWQWWRARAAAREREVVADLVRLDASQRVDEVTVDEGSKRGDDDGSTWIGRRVERPEARRDNGSSVYLDGQCQRAASAGLRSSGVAPVAL
jgi:hypothetical protein